MAEDLGPILPNKYNAVALILFYFSTKPCMHVATLFLEPKASNYVATYLSVTIKYRY